MDINKFMVPLDKAHYFIAGTVIYSFAVLIFTPFGALIPVIIASVGKELYDYYSNKGMPDINDFMFTLLGALPVLISQNATI